MRTVALISGGKDSCYNMMQCVSAGHNIVALANLQPLHKGYKHIYMYIYIFVDIVANRNSTIL